MKDLADPRILVAALAGLVLLLGIAAVLARDSRSRLSFALLSLLVATLGGLAYVLTLPLGSAAGLAVFLGLFAVIWLMGRFDSPE